MVDQKYCPCGGIILADTEDWAIPLCHECWLLTPECAAEKWCDRYYYGAKYSKHLVKAFVAGVEWWDANREKE